MRTASIVRRLARPIKKLWRFWNGVVSYYRRFGLRQLVLKGGKRLLSPQRFPALGSLYEAAAYQTWIKKTEPSPGELASQRREVLAQTPLISIVVPCHQTPLPYLKALVASVQEQTYQSWELCLTVTNSIGTGSQAFLDDIAKADQRVVIVPVEENLGIAGNTNRAIDQAKGEYIAFVDHDDTLAPFALYEVVKAINHSKTVDLIYSDEDKINQSGRERHSPHFKPDWNPELFRHYNYITHLLVLKRSLLTAVGLLNPDYDTCQDYDLTLRASEQASEIVHIPKVLYHWRQHDQSTAINPAAKPEVVERVVRVIGDHLRRIGRVGTVSPGPFFGAVNIRYALKTSPLVSIIIPNHDHADALKQCLDSILEKSTYKNYEIVVMENNSRDSATFTLYSEYASKGVRIVRWNKPFNYSVINNDGADAARGEILLFLNNDVVIITPDWLEQMLGQLATPEVGIVGAKLFYEDGSIQHAGVILGIGGIAGHSHKNFPHDDTGYFGRLQVAQNVSAVTGACLMIKRSTFDEADGFDTRLPIAFNDVDLCLKVRQHGRLIVWTPAAQLFHIESKTRGYEDTAEKQKRFLGEIDYFTKKWSDTIKAGDPYYSPNLTLAAEDFSINA